MTELVKGAWLKASFRHSKVVDEHLLPFIFIIVVTEHLAKHEFKQLLVGGEDLDKLLSFDPVKLLDSVVVIFSTLCNFEIDFKQLRFTSCAPPPL